MIVTKNKMKYLWDGLDLKNFEFIKIIPRRNAIIFMKDKCPESKMKWCIEHKGNGHYFETYEDLLNYWTSSKMSRLDRSKMTEV